jgi:hypothetical protein
MTTTEPFLPRAEAIRQALIDLRRETRPDGFTHDQLVARVAEMGHHDPVTKDEADAELETINHRRLMDALAWLERTANRIDKEIAGARSTHEDDDGDTFGILLHATAAEQLCDGLRTAAISIRGDLMLRGIL